MDKIKSAVRASSKAGPSRPSKASATQPKNSKSDAKDQKGARGDVQGSAKGKGKQRAEEVVMTEGTPVDGKLDKHAILLREIKSFGGTEEDLEMLRGIDSDSEAEESKAGPSKSPDDEKKLAKELKNFMATLGDLSKYHEPETDAEEQEEQSDSGEEAEAAEGAEEVVSDRDLIDEAAGVSQPEESEGEEQENATESEGEEDEEVPVKVANGHTSLPAPSTTRVANEVTPANAFVNSRSGMLVDPNPRWYDIDLPPLHDLDTSTLQALSSKDVERLHGRAKKLLQDLSDTFAGSLSSDTKGKGNPLNATSTLSTSDRAFIKTILTSGTESDKLSALMLLSSSSPIHTTTYLSQLLGLTKKKSRDQAVRAIRAIADWLLGGVGGSGSAGLPDRKLRWFAEQAKLPVVAHLQQHGLKKNGKSQGDEYLLLWAFEDWLKKWYFELLQVIEGLSHDPLPFVRTQMTAFISTLLLGKPEQEQNLLRLLVDKLADSDKSVSSRTSHHILQVIQKHPMMKGIIVKEVAALVLRPTNPAHNAQAQAAKAGKGKHSEKSGTSHAASLRSTDHSQYYGVITLNQIMLTRSEQDKLVANKLLEVYFSIFEDLLSSHAPDESALPAAPKDRKQRRDQKKGPRKSAEDELKGLSRQDRRKVQRSQQSQESESKMLAAVLTGVNRAYPYSDVDGALLHKRVDTLFRIIHTGTFNVGIQTLTLVFQVSSRQQSVSDRFYRVLYETLIDPRLAECSKQAMYLNLLFKALKADTSSKRVAAFVKRIMQILAYYQPAFVCGALFLLGELFAITPGLRKMFSEPEEADDDLEVFKDAPDSDSEKESPEDQSKDLKGANQAPGASSKRDTKSYDGRKRDPQYAYAEYSCLWEIIPLLSHYHPSVALHASQLLLGQTITTKPDLELHTLSHFLDRFVYRNPKKAAQGSASVMKPGANGMDRSGMVLMRKGVSGPTISAETPFNDEKFAKRAEQDIPVDQLFFHRFFNQKIAEETQKQGKVDKKRKRKSQAGADNSDFESDDEISIGDDDAEAADILPSDGDLEDESEDSDADEAEVWKAMKATMPPADGDADLMADSDDSADDSDGGSVADFAYSDDSEEDAAMDAILAGEDDDDEEEAEDEDEENADLRVDADFEMADVDEEDDEEEADEADGPEPPYAHNDDDLDDVPTFEDNEEDLVGSDEEIQLAEGMRLPEDKKARNKENKNKKRKLKHLPAFASADDWKDLIDMGDSD